MDRERRSLSRSVLLITFAEPTRRIFESFLLIGFYEEYDKRREKKSGLQSVDLVGKFQRETDEQKNPPPSLGRRRSVVSSVALSAAAVSPITNAPEKFTQLPLPPSLPTDLCLIFHLSHFLDRNKPLIVIIV